MYEDGGRCASVLSASLFFSAFPLGRGARTYYICAGVFVREPKARIMHVLNGEIIDWQNPLSSHHHEGLVTLVHLLFNLLDLNTQHITYVT